MVAIVKIVEQADPTHLVILPITPKELPESGQADSRTFHVVGAGTYSLPIGRDQQHFPVAGTLPGALRLGTTATNGPPQIHDWKPPQVIVDQVKDWMARASGLRYQADTLAGQLDVAVYLDKYKFVRVGGMGDQTFELEFIEWRTLNVRVDDGSSSTDPTTAPTDQSGDASTEPAIPSTYTVLPGDTLSSIAQQLLGDTARWREIADANTIDDVDSVVAGDVLVIPGGTAPATDMPDVVQS